MGWSLTTGLVPLHDAADQCQPETLAAEAGPYSFYARARAAAFVGNSPLGRPKVYCIWTRAVQNLVFLDSRQPFSPLPIRHPILRAFYSPFEKRARCRRRCLVKIDHPNTVLGGLPSASTTSRSKRAKSSHRHAQGLIALFDTSYQSAVGPNLDHAVR